MDIDLETQTSFDPRKIFPNWVRASNVINGKLMPHPCGVYPQGMAVDPVTKLAAVPYTEAEALGYRKLDFLHLTIYDYFSSRDEVVALLRAPAPFDLMMSPKVVSQLFQLANHYEMVSRVRPRSVHDVADCVALIRPGKIGLLDRYLNDKDKTRYLLYKQSADERFSFKKSHSYAYAHVIMVQLHLINGGVSFDV